MHIYICKSMASRLCPENLARGLEGIGLYSLSRLEIGGATSSVQNAVAKLIQ